MWTVWDRKSEINGFSAEWYLNRNPHLKDEETIYIKTADGVVHMVAGKGVLASIYGIDPALPDDEFIAEYERIITEPTEPDEPVEPSDSVTYDELAQVYASGVNSIDE